MHVNMQCKPQWICADQRNTLLEETFLSFNHVGPRDWTQIINLGDKAALPAEPCHQHKTPTQFLKNVPNYPPTNPHNSST